MTESESSDYESMDSDEELQAAFASGKLKPGLNYEVEPVQKTFFNNTEGMKEKLKKFQQDMRWLERLELTNDPAPPPPGTNFTEVDVDDDFRRELKFYCQAQASVITGISRLHELNVPTKRPEDYFAEMAKSDDHMKKVREKLLERQIGMEKSEKAKKMRELRKYGKKVQHEVLLKRQKDKREMLQSIKKYRKGKLDQLDFLEDAAGIEGKKKQKSQQNGDKKRMQPNKKRQFKNQKYGFGGQKKRSKHNTKASSSDVSEFTGLRQNKGKKSKKGRPGKTKRMKMKNRK